MYISVQDALFCYLIPGKACDPASSQASAPRQASQPLKVGSASVARHRFWAGFCHTISMSVYCYVEAKARIFILILIQTPLNFELSWDGIEETSIATISLTFTQIQLLVMPIQLIPSLYSYFLVNCFQRTRITTELEVFEGFQLCERAWSSNPGCKREGSPPKLPTNGQPW